MIKLINGLYVSCRVNQLLIRSRLKFVNFDLIIIMDTCIFRCYPFTRIATLDPNGSKEIIKM